jgi:hypothetical protein
MCLQITLGEDHGSGHFYLAKNRTFLLCVDSRRATLSRRQLRNKLQQGTNKTFKPWQTRKPHKWNRHSIALHHARCMSLPLPAYRGIRGRQQANLHDN